MVLCNIVEIKFLPSQIEDNFAFHQKTLIVTVCCSFESVKYCSLQGMLFLCVLLLSWSTCVAGSTQVDVQREQVIFYMKMHCVVQRWLPMLLKRLISFPRIQPHIYRLHYQVDWMIRPKLKYQNILIKYTFLGEHIPWSLPTVFHLKYY